ncbi:efflux RND transporter periplasmic adaptor subunit [Thalassotalea castellviae]|uniref:Efflux RND transporter periplasmic adaptor subunit n=1 Tax=Thalassotalea castellviae TaxID=3075612 RepID=A0ABU3A5T3_9GAMM|nr:efflux RND transporter periplasmic adaptor subunit [Thalassotalea sp. W431]MDT0605195.1 efflux RND transporter periplasmic adaptor subunit [Thalassotalea sp. W431]
MKLFWYSLWLFVFFTVSQVSAQSTGAKSAANVITLPISFENITSRVEAVGTAEAIRSVVLYPAVADKVTEVNFVPGQRVEEREVLLRLDSRRQKVALERVTIQLADAERTVKRLIESRRKEAIAQSALDDAITARDLLKVQLIEVKTELEDRVVRAPFSGVVGLTDVEPGDRIGLQTPITTIDNRERLLINFDAPETALPMLQGKSTVELEPWQARGTRINAQIIEVDSRINLTNRSIRVRALLDNIDDVYRPGMSFRVIMQMFGEAYAVVPEAALMWGATTAYVWIVEDGKAKKIDVQIQQRLTGRLLLSGELKTNDQLIVEGVQSLREGQTVNAVLSKGESL